MVRRKQPALAMTVSSAAVPLTTSLRTFAPLTATGTALESWTATWASVSLVRLAVKSLPLYSWSRRPAAFGVPHGASLSASLCTITAGRPNVRVGSATERSAALVPTMATGRRLGSRKVTLLSNPSSIPIASASRMNSTRSKRRRRHNRDQIIAETIACLITVSSGH